MEAYSGICGRTFRFADYNAKFFQGFANYLTTVRKMVDGTVGRRLVFLRMFLNWCVRTGLTKSTEFREVRILKGQKARHIHLTEEELAAVATLDLEIGRSTCWRRMREEGLGHPMPHSLGRNGLLPNEASLVIWKLEHRALRCQHCRLAHGWRILGRRRGTVLKSRRLPPGLCLGPPRAAPFSSC